ncbi:TetR/AcrR family transcriptional regulator [Streptomyces sp. NPDC019937]|uniref:TetR/AcrR family transcriptional regulator n=1 Tax=Streptomyces sp. NPDC019937 TaxID=3154787 RepID=UPI0033C08D4E
MARPRSFDHDHVLHAAERQFRTSGYNGTSVDDISAATGLGRGSLYAAFDGKHGVLLQAMGRYSARLGLAVEVLAGPDEGALERLHGFLLRAVHGVPLAHDVPPAPDRAAAACFAAKMALELGASDPEVERMANACFSAVATSVAECVRAAQRSGDIDPDADPDDLAYLLLTIVRGIDVVGASGHSPARLTSIAESAFALLPRRHHR